jgi:hypothetical protein
MLILNKIQKELKAPKNQKNSFGNYNYRSCEDILEAVKPLLGEASLTLTDDIVLVGDRYYVKATATLTMGSEGASCQAYAREALDKKGMDAAQITGAASSYARKYALNGLFCIDDNKDNDRTNTDVVVEYISDAQKNLILDSLLDLGVDLSKFLAYMKIESLEKMTTLDHQKAMAAIEAKRKAKL